MPAKVRSPWNLTWLGKESNLTCEAWVMCSSDMQYMNCICLSVLESQQFSMLQKSSDILPREKRKRLEQCFPVLLHIRVVRGPKT